jgi:hypothetical protein
MENSAVNISGKCVRCCARAREKIFGGFDVGLDQGLQLNESKQADNKEVN